MSSVKRVQVSVSCKKSLSYCQDSVVCITEMILISSSTGQRSEDLMLLSGVRRPHLHHPVLSNVFLNNPNIVFLFLYQDIFSFHLCWDLKHRN